MRLFIAIIHSAAQILSLLIIIHSVLSFFVPPYNPIQVFLSRILDPLYAPIRKLVKPMGGLDLSPMILLILIYVLESVLARILGSL